MNKKLREILAKIDAKNKEVNELLNGETKDFDKTQTLLDEIELLQKEYNLEKRKFELERDFNIPTESELENKQKVDSIAAFAKAVKTILSGKSLVEGTDENGGYIVPEDIQTKVQYWRDTEFSLLSLISTENVTTNKGSRTYQKKGEANALVELDEEGEIANEIEAPKFERISYVIKDYAGFMPVSNNLINDSDNNVTEIVTQWLGKVERNTANKMILDLIKTKAETDLKNINGIKKALNVTLGQAYKSTSAIITNDDGLNYLDTLEDKNGRPLLNPDPTNSAQLQLRCGATVVPIQIIPNKFLSTSETKVPFIIGDLKEAIKKFDRQEMSMMASSVAQIGDVNAFSQNMTLFRVIERFDFKELDKDAYVNGYITVA